MNLINLQSNNANGRQEKDEEENSFDFEAKSNMKMPFNLIYSNPQRKKATHSINDIKWLKSSQTFDSKTIDNLSRKIVVVKGTRNKVFHPKISFEIQLVTD